MPFFPQELAEAHAVGSLKPPLDSETPPPRGASVALLLVIVALYLSSIGQQWFPTPDSALYLSLGRNLAHGKGFSLWGETFTDVPPGYPALVALISKLGLESIAWHNACMILIALFALGCCWRCLRYWTSERLALLALAVLASSFTLHFNAIRLLTDIPCMALFWAGLLLCQRALAGNSKRLRWGVLLLLSACLMRVPGLLLVGGAALGLYWEGNLAVNRASARGTSARRTGIFLAAILGILVVCLTLLLTQAGGGSHSPLTHLLSSLSFKRIFLDPWIHFWLSGEEVSVVMTGQSSPMALAWFLFGIPCFVGMRASWRRQQRQGISIVLCYLCGLWFLRPALARYLLPVLPLLIWYYLEGVYVLASWRPRWSSDPSPPQRGGWWLRPTQTVFLVSTVLITINLPKVFRSIYWLHAPTLARDFQERQDLREVAAFLRENARPEDRFMSNTDQRIISYLSGVDSIPLTEARYKGRPLREADIDSWRKHNANFLVVGVIHSHGHAKASEKAIWDASMGETWHDESLLRVFDNGTFKVYTDSPRSDTDVRRYETLQRVANAIQQAASTEDLLYMPEDAEQVAYLGGVNAYRSHSDHLDSRRGIESALEQGVSLIALLKLPPMKVFWDRVRRMRRQPGLHEVDVDEEFAFFTTRVEVARKLEPDPDTRAVSELLRRHRLPNDRLATNGDSARISLLSKVPSIDYGQLPRELSAADAPPGELFDQWLAAGANWVILRLGEQRTARFWDLTHAARKHAQLHQVYSGDYCFVFCTRDLSPPEKIARRPEEPQEIE